MGPFLFLPLGERSKPSDCKSDALIGYKGSNPLWQIINYKVISMCKPEFKKVTFFEMDSNDFDRLVKILYPFLKKYEFVPIQEANNYSYYDFDVNGKLDEWDLKKWEESKNSGKFPTFSNYTLLNKMCKDGFIESGKYIIKVFW